MVYYIILWYGILYYSGGQMDYDELKQKVEQRNSAISSKFKNNYHYARSKGFSAIEANYLKHKSPEEIDAIATDRDSKRGV